LIQVDHNRVGTAYGLTVYTAITPGHENEVRTTIEALSKDDGPFSRLPMVHFARLQIFDHLVYQGAPQKPEQLRSHYLVFTSSFDGSRDPFLDAICDLMPAEADSWWSHCVGYPGTADRAAFRRWMHHNQIPTHLITSPYPTASVQDVLESLELRERLVAFAVDAQGLDAKELQERFRQTFADVS